MSSANKVYFGTNLKMYMDAGTTKEFIVKLIDLTKGIDREKIELFVLPSFTALQIADSVADRWFIKIGAQNMHWERQGPFTGEISPPMLKEFSIDIVEIGHSDRRHLFGETDENECKKVRSALEFGFTALLCVGETKQQKEYGIADNVLSTQLRIGLSKTTATQLDRVWIAYEPVWAIGDNSTAASPEYVRQRSDGLRATLVDLFGEAGRNVPLLYGGSVDHANASHFLALPNINGLFIGRYAWEAKRFAHLISTLVT